MEITTPVQTTVSRLDSMRAELDRMRLQLGTIRCVCVQERMSDRVSVYVRECVCARGVLVCVHEKGCVCACTCTNVRTRER